MMQHKHATIFVHKEGISSILINHRFKSHLSHLPTYKQILSAIIKLETFQLQVFWKLNKLNKNEDTVKPPSFAQSVNVD